MKVTGIPTERSTLNIITQAAEKEEGRQSNSNNVMQLLLIPTYGQRPVEKQPILRRV